MAVPPKGRRIRDRVPGGHWKILTILGAMDHTGMLATRTVESATDGDVFQVFLDHVLCPKLRAAASAIPQLEHATTQDAKA